MGGPQYVSPTCEWRDCTAAATTSINAQWTIFDFVRYEACQAHAGALYGWLGRRRVDGSEPLDMWVTYYDPPEVEP
jgi:hypothetical protein